MASTCADVPPRTLTFQCGGACKDYEACLVYGPSDVCNTTVTNMGRCVGPPDTPAKCSYQCFAWNERPTDTFSFYISNGAYKSEQERNSEKVDPQWQAKKSALFRYDQYFPSAINDRVESVNVLTLPPYTTKVMIIGGPDLNGLKGYVADVEVTRGLLLKQNQVTSVAMTNLNLGLSLSSLSSLFPLTISSIDISNNLLQYIPTDLPLFTALTVVFAKDNYITRVPPELKMDNLIKLNLRGNNLTSFEAKFPKLQELSLAVNNFNQIPNVIYSFSELQILNMSKNPIKNLTVTPTQLTFLKRLDTFVLDNSTLTLTCPLDQRQDIHNVTVCVGQDFPDAHASSGSAATPSPKSVTEHSVDSNQMAAGLSSGFVVMVLLVIALACYVKRRRQRVDRVALVSPEAILEDKNETRRTGFSKYMLASDTMSSELFDSSSEGYTTSKSSRGISEQLLDEEFTVFRLDKSKIEEIRQLGRGGFGDVWLVHFNGENYASKRLRRECATRTRLQGFLHEIQINASLKHDRIVRFIGVAWSTEKDVQALFELMENGDLRTCLERSILPRSWTKDKIQIALDIVEALVYVHSFSPPLVHRDLKSRNVLLTKEPRAKLCDFGVSRFRSEHGTMTVGVGTALWVAPEVITGEFGYGEKADIYSFGVVLSELDSHQLPYEDVRGGGGDRLAEVAVIHRVGLGNLTPSFLETCPDGVSQLARRCLAFQPADRPSAVEIAYLLSTLQQQQQPAALDTAEAAPVPEPSTQAPSTETTETM